MNQAISRDRKFPTFRRRYPNSLPYLNIVGKRRLDLITSLVGSGASYDQVGRMFGVSRQRIHQILWGSKCQS